jgi:hypothetical protein
MKTPQSYLIGAAIFCTCAVSVWALRGGSSAYGASSATAESSSRMPSKTSRSARGKAGVPVDVAEALSAVRAGRTIEDRLRATIQLAESIPVGNLEEWFKEEWFDGREDMQNYLFYRIARARWLAADPEGLMSYCLREKSDRLQEIAGIWAERDPTAALTFAAELRDSGERSTFLSNIGYALAKADPQQALEGISGLAAKLDRNQIHGLSEIIRGLADSSPGLLKGKLHELPGSLQPTARNYLTRGALKQDFRAAVAELANSADGRNQFVQVMESNSDLMKEINKHLDALPRGWFAAAASKAGYYLVRDDPKKWLDADLSAMDFSPEQAERLRSYALASLGDKDPKQVIALLAGQTLTEDERSSAIYSVVGKMASDKEKVEAWIATLTDEKDIEHARSALSSQTAGQKKEITPTSLLACLTEDGTSLDWGQVRAVTQWNNEDRATLAKEFAALPPEQKGRVATKLLDDRNQRGFPTLIRADALRYLLENPKPPAEPGSPASKEDSRRLTVAAAMIGSSWANEDPNTASRWVTSLPVGDERVWAAKNLAARWWEYEPAAAKAWVSSLPTAEREEVQKYLDSGEAYR